MADDMTRAHTHFQSLESKIDQETTAPAEPQVGDFYYDTTLNRLYVYVSTSVGWKYGAFTTTTSTSTSVTTTSTSVTTTSISTTTSMSTSTSTTTSTTTTL